MNIKTKRLILIALLIILSALEIFAYQSKGVFAVAASRAWLVFGGVVLVMSLYVSGKAIIQDIRERNWFSLVILAGITVVMFWGVGNIGLNAMNDEATIQVADGLTALKAADFNYTGTGYGIYPARQFVLMALPTAVLGRSQFALQIGFVFALLLGFTVAYAGLRKYFVERIKTKPLYAAVALLACLTFPYFINYMFVRDQAIISAAFIMQAIGWLCLIKRERSVISFACFAWVCAMMATSFTAGFAGWGLALVFLAIMAVRFWKSKARNAEKNKHLLPVITSVFVYILVFGLMSFLMLRQTQGQSFNADRANYVADTINALRLIFLGDPVPYIAPFFVLPVGVYFVLSLTGLLGYKNFITVLWALATVFAAVNFKGSGLARVDHTILRTLIIIPVITVMMSITVIKIVKKYIKPAPEEEAKGEGRFFSGLPLLRLPKAIIINILIIIVIACNIFWSKSVPNQWDHYRNDDSRVASYIAFDIQKTMEKHGKQSNKVLFFKGGGRDLLGRICKYSAPEADITVLGGNDQAPDGLDLDKLILIYADMDGNIPHDLILRYGEPEIVKFMSNGVEQQYKRIDLGP